MLFRCATEDWLLSWEEHDSSESACDTWEDVEGEQSFDDELKEENYNQKAQILN